MKKFLIPVDFSEYSQVAIDYALQIASESGHEIDFIHVFTNHSNLYINKQLPTTLVDPQVEISKNKMATLLPSCLAKNPNIKINCIYKDGNLFEEISKVTASFAYDAVIMGTRGSSGLEAVFLGSNTYDVIINTKTPVLAIPLQTKKYKHQRVGLLCNFKQGEIDVLKQAIKVIGAEVELVLIHINKIDLSITEINQKFTPWIDEIIKQTGIDNISYTIKSQASYIRATEDMTHAIDSVIIDEQIDLLLITKSKKSVFRKLIDENIVKKMAYDTSIPKFFAKVNTDTIN